MTNGEIAQMENDDLAAAAYWWCSHSQTITQGFTPVKSLLATAVYKK